MLAPLEPLEPIRKNWVQLFCGYLIQVLAHLAVFGNRLDLKDIAQIAELFSVFDSSLELQQGCVLEKHHGKGAHQTIMHAVADFTALSAVIQFSEVLRKGCSESCEVEMFFTMHQTLP